MIVYDGLWWFMIVYDSSKTHALLNKMNSELNLDDFQLIKTSFASAESTPKSVYRQDFGLKMELLSQNTKKGSA